MSDPQESPFRKAAVERLASPDQLDRLVTIADRGAWMALAGLFLLLASTLAWACLGSVASTVTARGILVRDAAQPEILRAVVYLPGDLGKRVQAGMAVRLTGSLLGPRNGRITQVSEFPVTRAAMLADLYSERLAASFAGDGAVHAARVDIGSADVRLAGSRVEALVTLRRQRPIELVLPFLDKQTHSD